MPLYEVQPDRLQRRAPARFSALGIYERTDLQRLLRAQPDVLGEDLLIVAEEFGEWEDSRRRIDLLAIDREAHLVVIELKRTDDGGHMDLQALRYAAMVSAMTFNEVAAVRARHATTLGISGDGDSTAELREFLGIIDDSDDTAISTDVRIILVSADFGRELTTAVLWLNRFEGMDIRCVRLVPYEIDDTVYLDVQQVIPLPEAGDYQIRLRQKDAARERSVRNDGRDLTKFQIVVDGVPLPATNKRHSVRLMITNLAERGVSLESIHALLPDRALRTVPGQVAAGTALADALHELYPTLDVDRCLTDFPIYDANSDRTYVLFKMWGRQTEQTLKALADAFPSAGVTVKLAEQ